MIPNAILRRDPVATRSRLSRSGCNTIPLVEIRAVVGRDIDLVGAVSGQRGLNLLGAALG
jgi:hypothetical protein